MGLPRAQQVSDLLHDIANLVQEADAYLCESSLSPTPFAKSGKKRPSPRLGPLAFAKCGKKHNRSKNLFSPIKRTPLKKSGLQPHKVDSFTNRMRKIGERAAPPERDILRAKRERKQRSRYQANKLTGGANKVFGSRMRNR